MAKARGKKGEVAPVLQRVSARFELRPALAALKTISQPARFSRQILRHLNPGVSLNRLPGRLANGYASLAGNVLARYGRFNQTFNPIQRALRMPRRPQLPSGEDFTEQPEANFAEWTPFADSVAPASLPLAASPDYFENEVFFEADSSRKPTRQAPTALGRAFERLEKPEAQRFSNPENEYAATNTVERSLSFPAMIWRKLAGFEPAQASATSPRAVGGFEPILPAFSQPEISHSATIFERPGVSLEAGSGAVRQGQAALPATSGSSPAQSAVHDSSIERQQIPSIQRSTQGAGSYGLENTAALYSNPRQSEGVGSEVFGPEGAVARHFEPEISRAGIGLPLRLGPTALARALARTNQPLAYLPQAGASFGIKTPADFARAALTYRTTGQINRQVTNAQENWAEPEIARSYQPLEAALPLHPEIARVYQSEAARLSQAEAAGQPSPETVRFNQIEAGKRLSPEAARLSQAETSGIVSPEVVRFSQAGMGGLISPETTRFSQAEGGGLVPAEVARLYRAEGGGLALPGAGRFNQIGTRGLVSTEIARIYRAERGSGGGVANFTGNLFSAEASLPLVGGRESGLIARQYGIERQTDPGWAQALPALRHNPVAPLTVHNKIQSGLAMADREVNEANFGGGDLPLYHRIARARSGVQGANGGSEPAPWLGWADQPAIINQSPVVDQAAPATGASLTDQAIIQRLHQLERGPISPANFGADKRLASLAGMEGREAPEASFAGRDLPLYHRIARSNSSDQMPNIAGTEQALWFNQADQPAFINPPVQATGASLADRAVIERLRQLERGTSFLASFGADNRADGLAGVENSGLGTSLAPGALQRVISRLEGLGGLNLNLTPAEVSRYLNEPPAGTTPGANVYGSGQPANATYPSNAGVGDYITPPLVLRKAGEYAPDRPEPDWRPFGESAAEIAPFRAGIALERAYQPLTLQATAPQTPDLPELKLASIPGTNKVSPVSNTVARIVQPEAESSFSSGNQAEARSTQSHVQIERLPLPLAAPGPRLQTIAVPPEVLVDAAVEAVESRLSSLPETGPRSAPAYNPPSMPLATHFANTNGQSIGVVGAVQPGVTIQRKVSDAAPSSQVSAGLPPLDTVLRTSAGKPLDSGVQGRMGEIFGTRFDHVRVHTEGPAADYAAQVGAEAFTHGSNIVFRAGRYQPQTITGQALIGHELTHVIQQASLPSLGQGRMPETSPQGQALEHIAQRNERVLMEHLSSPQNGRSNGSAWDSGTTLAATNTVIERVYQPVETNHLRPQEAQVRRATSGENAAANSTTVRRVNEDGFQVPGEGPASPEVDVKLLANQVYQLLKERLMVERERSGLRGGSFF